MVMTGSLLLIEITISVGHGKNYYLKIVLLGTRLTSSLCVKSLLYRYLRITGTYNSMNRSFHLVSFACLYTTHHFNISEDGLISKSVSIFNHTSILKHAMYPFFLIIYPFSSYRECCKYCC